MKQYRIPGFKSVPQTGVIYVMKRAGELGYKCEDLAWANLGQGAPETTPLPGAPPRIKDVQINPSLHEYSPVSGQIALRQKVADLYNQLYRQGKSSLYTWENVSIAGGGRIALTRIAASLGNINLGHFLPDYTAYEQLLGVFRAFVSIPILLDPEVDFHASLKQMHHEITGRGLKAILMSNPCNPTGQLVEGEDLNQWVNFGKKYRCSMIMDEFYSHYVYTKTENNNFPKMISAAQYVENVDRDPVIILDGLTKNWRYPGWRISWTIGPKSVIQTIASAGSFLDGGANNPLQQQAIQLLDTEWMLQEARALQTCFLKKRDFTLQRLAKMGIKVEAPPQGTFYVWANLEDLPEPLNDGFQFFELGLAEKVITVPGIFFDVNPGKRRPYARFSKYARISFGPEQSQLEKGLTSLERLIQKHS